MALVEVTLMDDHEPCTVHGTITASSNLFPDHKSVLFMKTLDEGVTVKPGNHIPLSRSVVAVPFDGYLTLSVDLHDGNKESLAKTSGPCKQNIARRSEVFHSKNSGSSGKKHLGCPWEDGIIASGNEVFHPKNPRTDEAFHAKTPAAADDIRKLGAICVTVTWKIRCGNWLDGLGLEDALSISV